MDLDARPYRAFVAIAEERSFSRAAERLHVSQPALSAQIREFERRLGFALFARTSRTVELTAQGRMFLGNARRLVAETELAQTAARAIGANQLTVGAAPQTVTIPERMALLERFATARPDIPLRVTNRSDARHLAELARREIELAVVIEPVVGGAVTYSPLDPLASLAADLERQIIRQRSIMLLVPREDKLSRLAVLPAQALGGRRIATIDRTHGIALTEALSAAIQAGGGTPIRPPERNALAVERHGALTRTLAVTLGWYGGEHLNGLGPVVARPVEGWSLATALTLLRARGEMSPGTAAFWETAQRFAADLAHDSPQKKMPVRGRTGSWA